MAQAVETVLGERISAGLVVVKTDHSAPTTRVEIVEATHPVPDAAGVAAGQRILALAETAGADGDFNDRRIREFRPPRPICGHCKLFRRSRRGPRLLAAPALALLGVRPPIYSVL